MNHPQTLGAQNTYRKFEHMNIYSILPTEDTGKVDKDLQKWTTTRGAAVRCHLHSSTARPPATHTGSLLHLHNQPRYIHCTTVEEHEFKYRAKGLKESSVCLSMQSSTNIAAVGGPVRLIRLMISVKISKLSDFSHMTRSLTSGC